MGEPLRASQGDELTVVLLGQLVDDVRVQVHDVIVGVRRWDGERLD
jgi:hypothetical protein